jgi:hypothetical protein
MAVFSWQQIRYKQTISRLNHPITMNSNIAVFYNISLVLLVILSVCKGEYSVNFYSKASLVPSISFSYNIKVNGETEIFGEPSTDESGTGWINFNAKAGDVVNVFAETALEELQFELFYHVHNAPNGGGSMIYDSRSDTFTPPNTCTADQSPCPLFMGMLTNFAFGWENSKATIYFNGVPVYSDYDGSEEIELSVKSTDVISIVFTFSSTANNVGYYLSAEEGGSADGTIKWFYNSYGTFVLMPNPFPLSSPFGGSLYPISSEQEDSFATTLSSGGSTRWIRNQ